MARFGSLTFVWFVAFLSIQAKRPEVEYMKDEGYVRLNIRRPVNLYVPTELQESYNPESKSKDPSSSLELEWVYGYRGKDSRNNVFKLESGELVYFAAGVAVIYDPQNNSQRHYTEHTDDIKCLAVHPDGKTVATGQIKGRDDNEPHVRVWNSETLETISEFGSDTFSRGVSCVAFSNDGELVAAVDDSPEPKLSLWKWGEQEKLSEAKAASDNVIAVTFTRESTPRIVTSGKGHLAFWTFSPDGGDLSKRSGIFGNIEKPKYVTSVAALESGDIITGDTNGNLLVWEQGGNTVGNSVKGAHDEAIFFVGIDEDGHIITAGKDQKVVEYTTELEPTKQMKEIPEEFGTPRMVIKMGDDLYMGTNKNAIIKTSFGSDERTVITQGHLEELWGGAAFHSEPLFVTAGQDGQVYCRNATSHQILWNKTLEMKCQSAEVTHSDQMTIVGGDSGKWVVINNEDQEIVHEGQDGDEPLQVIRFSPDGTKLALGSRDNKVYIYSFDEAEKSFSKVTDCEGHSSFITHLDWSEDGEMLRTNSGDYEVLFWKTDDGSQVTQSEEYKDVQWATNNCILSFNAIGIWPPGTDGTHINSCNKAMEKPLLATGDDFGMLKLFAYPSIQQNAQNKTYHGHSSHITNVIFFSNDSLVLSSGGRDTTAMQWKIVDEE